MAVAESEIEVEQSRWVVAVAGVAMQLLLGTVYAWSVFKRPLMEAHGWSNTEVGLAFTLAVFFIGLSAAFGGGFVDQAGARRVATVAAVRFGLGTLLAGGADSTGSKLVLWLGYGVIGGIGNGLGYVTPLAVLVRWFPDKRGLITGLAVMGFGLGAALMGQIAPLIMPHLGLANSFYLFGVVFLLVLLAAAQKLNNPPPGWVPPVSLAARNRMTVLADCDLSTALGMGQFYLLWSILFLNVTAGIALISNLSPMAQAQTGVSAVIAGTVVLISSLANGFGRILWASLSDRLGRKLVFLLLLGTQVPVLLLLPHLTSPILFAVACCYILLCYGGGFATMPAFAADTFGARCMGQIYGKILLAWGAAGVVGPMLMEYVHKQSGSFSMALYIAAGLLTLGFLLALAYRRPQACAAPKSES
ncbi:MAG: OFA family MFS transporter [candidate division WS1 bacterium]|nr:OFA family MFS transporter [candidate division WS1 bacterium]